MSQPLLDPTAAVLLPLESLRRYTMCPILEARSGGNHVVFARRADVATVVFAWFELDPEDTAVVACELRTDVPEQKYRRFLAGLAKKLAPPPVCVSPESAKTRVFRAVHRGERAGRFPPKEFSWVAALLDGIALQLD
ncbi:MAG: hypothetical protein GXP31_11575 [Kiritimatiellaeota bacterium]|nr:hypothetical protein [Kiritimatiellota bacterium]